MKPTIMLVVLLFPVVCASVFAQSRSDEIALLLPHLEASRLAELEEKKEIVHFTEAPPVFALLPRTPLAEAVKTELTGFPASVAVEVLFILPMPQPAAGRTPIEHIYRRLREISSLSGIQFFSNHYQTWRVLFSDVYEIESLRARRRIPDRIAERILPAERFNLHMRDANFGGGFYEANFSVQNEALTFGLRNMGMLSFFIIPVIGEQRVRFQILAVPMPERNELLLYGICAVEASDFLRRMVHLPSAFHTRILALKRWFEQRVY